jgi:mRNA-degrading endonuclease RelE of RelBE toxin-antitoxin system
LKYEVGLDIDAAAFINTQNVKTRRIIHSHLKSLEDDPFCGKGGDKELLNTRPGVKIERLHIGRSFTAIYVIEEKSVLVTEVMTIGQAHKKYNLY